MKKLFLSMILMALPLVVSAYDIEVINDDDVRICYKWINDQTELEVTFTGVSFGANFYSGNIVIPESVIYKGNSYNVTSIGTRAFRISNVSSVSIPNTVTKISDSAFENCLSLTSVNIPNSVTSIGQSAFYGCEKLTSITIPDGVTIIKDNTFAMCKKLSSINFGDSVESIGSSAFYGCESLTSLVIPNTVSYIGFGAFGNCSGLQTLTFGSGLKSICTSSFYGNEILTDVYCLAEEVPEVITNSYYKIYKMFENTVYENATLHVPAGLIDAYKSAEGWKLFKNIVAIEKPKYSLKYFLDGVEYNSFTLEEGENITPELDPEKEGYSFSGWSEIPETMPANDVIITGSFTINKYKLTYLLDGEEFKSSEVEFGSAITAEDNPTKEGYTFSGWSEIPETMPASDITISGTFTINKYKLTYTVDGEEYKTAEIDYGTVITPEENPVKEGYTFSGWSEIPETMPANDVTVTGTFTVNKYKLTYMVDGEEYKASEVDYGMTITAEAVPTKEGYTFSGWSEIPSTMPANDVTVTGTFTVNKYTITYMVDDAVLMTEEVAYGSTIAPPKSQKDGYDILWSSHPTTMPAYDITIYGTYTTGISSLNVEEKDRQVFTPDGKRVETPKKGLNIIRMSDGTVKKVVVK